MGTRLGAFGLIALRGRRLEAAQTREGHLDITCDVQAVKGLSVNYELNLL
jgi:hypothetical protein